MLKFHLTTHRCTLTPADRAALDAAIAHLGRHLRDIDPDLVHLQVIVERHPRREEYLGDVRLVVMNRAMPARRNASPTISALLHHAFADVEEQLERFMAHLRRDYGHARRHTAEAHRGLRFHHRELLEEHTTLERARAGDRAAFDAIVELELPSLRNIITGELHERGLPADTEAVHRVVTSVLDHAAANLPQKPGDWSMIGWLADLARDRLDRDGVTVLAR